MTVEMNQLLHAVSRDKHITKLSSKKHSRKIKTYKRLLRKLIILAKNNRMVTKNPAFARLLFTDGFNSFAHFALGWIAVYLPILVPLFTLYQMLDPRDVNMYVDILEFVIGFSFSLFFK